MSRVRSKSAALSKSFDYMRTVLTSAQPVRVAPAPPLSAYRQACERARAMAMKTGRCIRVGE